MSPLVFDLLGNLPQLAVVYVQTRLLPMRRPGLFAALAMAVAFTAMLLFSWIVFKRYKSG